MTRDATSLLLKLLSGPNTGAEMELAPGDWLLGSGDDSQILVLDAGVWPQHLLLRIDASGGLTLIPKEGTALVDGASVPPEGMAVPPFAVFTVGGTHAACGPAHEPWPSLGLPPLATPAGAETPEPGTEEDREPGAKDALKANNVGSGNKVGASSWRRRIFLSLPVLLVLGLALDYAQPGFFFSDAKRDAASLAKNLHRRGFTGLTVTARQDGSLLVHGAVPSNPHMESLVRYVETLKINPGLDVVSLEDMVATLRAQAQRSDAPLRITRGGGLLRINGYAYDMQALEQLLAEERESLAAVPLRVDVISWRQAEKELRGFLAARGLDSKTRLIPDLYRISLQSRPLSSAEQQALRGVIQEAEDFFGVEGVIGVERWRTVEKTIPRPASSGTTLFAQKKAPEQPGAADPAPKREPEQSLLEKEPETPPDLSGGLDDLAAHQEFSCAHIRIVGEGHDMGVLMGGVLYKTGAKMPDNMQVKLVTPNYVVLQRGKVHTRICTAAETLKTAR